jgi:hypothetical protein
VLTPVVLTPVPAITRPIVGSGRVGGVRARWLVVKRTSPKCNRTFRRKVVLGGRTYSCKR